MKELLLSFEKNLLISLLKLTKTGAASQESVKLDAKLPTSVSSILLKKLQNESLVYLRNDFVEATDESRLKLAVKAVQLGADVERVSDFLHWQEFESMASWALESNGYVTAKNVRFTHVKKRWEIDVVGCKKPLVVCVDCKQWHRGLNPSSLKRIVEAQCTRVTAFAESLPIKSKDFSCSKWENAVFVPVILSLIPFRARFYDEVPVVPVLQLQDFLQQLPLNLDTVKTIRKKFTHL